MDLAQMQSRGFDETGGEIDEKELLGDHLQPASFARAPRQVYKMLVQNIAEQLGTENKEALVFNQDAPDSLKDDSALKILQHLERKGVFSPHKIDELAELLRAISRHDLVSKFVDPYLQQYGKTYMQCNGWMCRV